MQLEKKCTEEKSTANSPQRQDRIADDHLLCLSAALYSPHPTNIIHLNDDCLYEIFRRITLRDQIVLTAVCKRFRDVIEQFFWTKMREVRTNNAEIEALPRSEFETLFRSIAGNLKKLTISNTTHLPIVSILGRYDWRPDLSFYFAMDHPQLCELNVEDSSLHDGFMRLVALRCPALQVLRVSSTYVTGAYIKDMRQLRKLFMPKCSLSAEHLRAILYSDLPLTHLDVSGNPSDYELELALNQVGFLKLRSLTLTENQFGYQFLSTLENLHDLCRWRVLGPFKPFTSAGLYENFNWSRFYIGYGHSVTQLHFYSNDKTKPVWYPFFMNSAKRNLLNLKKLHIDGSFRSFVLDDFRDITSLRELHLGDTDLELPDVLQLIVSCPHLKHVYLECLPDNFSDFLNWIDQLIVRLRSLPEHQLLTIHANRCPQEFIQSSSYCQQNVLKFEEFVPEETTSTTPYLEFGFSNDGITFKIP